VDVSREAGAFALSRGADEKAANTISLCIEEYGKNIMEWGFRDKVDPLLNVRLIRDGGKWRIYLKDAGRRFDPLAWLQEHGAAPKVAGEQIGIRLTAGLAADLKYVQELGLNAVIITVDDASRGADDRSKA
jgi:anti-sigma regulatory factor (Ser/Thr protein kinase)